MYISNVAVASLETALSGEQELRAEAVTALSSERQSVAEARAAQEAQVAEMQTLRERAEEVQARVEQQDRAVQQLRYDMTCLFRVSNYHIGRNL